MRDAASILDTGQNCDTEAEMRLIKNFIHNINDVVLAIIIVAVAAGIIYWRMQIILDYPKTIVENQVVTEETVDEAPAEEPVQEEPAPAEDGSSGEASEEEAPAEEAAAENAE